ncbi:triphosphoribosyl-dephospho-CoA synthase [Ramlibacter monticola]|uniref:Triphosphoribosyl-dephospho-CoA synthase n=1 Tax=Ramlibacter monticola TaxID=1926872 RepID=A0A936YZV4_9BURK|nr:triphosphoribosyl-dephospho-CoA synthase [Ramlibacter monticola]MBL0391611.1 triphosphoribosyl-dephospho-CoA synthase [Ramlibacter monticola]
MDAVPAALRAEFGRRAFLRACALDVQVRKPGNVSVASPGHGMRAWHFKASAAAAAGPISSAGAPVGERIEVAVRATWQAARCNTNLGIVLLCAPLLAAYERSGGTGGVEALRAAVREVLESLTVHDARAAYRAIALARPGGLGRAPEQDVAEAPTVNLREAMALAADRDRIAFQYLHAYPDVFDLGLPAFLAARDGGAARAMQAAFLEFVAALPDSHIVRKHGDAVAQCVIVEALPWRTRSQRGELLDQDPGFARWDEDLKARGLNPGTSADLSVAVALAAALAQPQQATAGAPPRFY